jgi:uncharacterized membrane protein (UPF0182 family)
VKNLNKTSVKTLLIIAFFLLLTAAAFVSQYKSLGWFTQLRYSSYWLKQIPAELDKSIYISVVVLSEQRNYVFYKDKFLKRYIVSTGSKDRYEDDRRLRTGIWRLQGRLDTGLKEMYGPRLIGMYYYNPYRKDWIKTMKAFHGTNEPENLGLPTSMGCVYHSNQDIVEIYDYIPDNTLVIVTKY